jgi:hypothetical protein
MNYSVSTEAPVVVTVYNMLGEVVESHSPATTGPGKYSEQFDAANWANGVYTVTISCNGTVSSVRMVVSHQ